MIAVHLSNSSWLPHLRYGFSFDFPFPPCFLCVCFFSFLLLISHVWISETSMGIDGITRFSPFSTLFHDSSLKLLGELGGNCVFLCFFESNFTISYGTKWENEKVCGGFLSLINFSVLLRNNEEGKWIRGFLLRMIEALLPLSFFFSFDVHGKWKIKCLRCFLFKPISPSPFKRRWKWTKAHKHFSFQSYFTIFLPLFWPL